MLFHTASVFLGELQDRTSELSDGRVFISVVIHYSSLSSRSSVDIHTAVEGKHHVLQSPRHIIAYLNSHVDI